MGHDLDAAKTQGFVQSLELGNRQLRGLQRHRPEADKTVRIAPADFGDKVVDGPRSLAPEIGIGAVIGLAGAGEIAWMSIPIRSMSAMRCSARNPAGGSAPR